MLLGKEKDDETPSADPESYENFGGRASSPSLTRPQKAFAIENYQGGAAAGLGRQGMRQQALKEVQYERDDSSSCVVVLGADEMSVVNEQQQAQVQAQAPAQTLSFKIYTNELDAIATGHRRVSNRYSNTADGDRSRHDQILKYNEQAQSYPQQIVNTSTIQDDNRIISQVKCLETPSPKESYTEQNFLSQKVTNKSPIHFGQSHQSVFGNGQQQQAEGIRDGGNGGRGYANASSPKPENQQSDEKEDGFDPYFGIGSELVQNRVNSLNTPPPPINLIKGVDLVRNILSNNYITHIGGSNRKTPEDDRNNNSFGSSNVIDASLVEMNKNNQEFESYQVGAIQRRQDAAQNRNVKSTFDNHLLTLGKQDSSEDVRQQQNADTKPAIDEKHFNQDTFRLQVAGVKEGNEGRKHDLGQKNDDLYNMQSIGKFSFQIDNSDKNSAKMVSMDGKNQLLRHSLLNPQSNLNSQMLRQTQQNGKASNERYDDVEAELHRPLKPENCVNNVQFTNSQNSSKFYKSVSKEPLVTSQQAILSSSIQASNHAQFNGCNQGNGEIEVNRQSNLNPLVTQMCQPVKKERLQNSGSQRQSVLNYDSNSSRKAKGSEKKGKQGGKGKVNAMNMHQERGQGWGGGRRIHSNQRNEAASVDEKNAAGDFKSNTGQNRMKFSLMNNSSVQKSRRLNEQHKKLIAFSRDRLNRPTSQQVMSGKGAGGNGQFPNQLQKEHKRSFSASLHELIKAHEGSNGGWDQQQRQQSQQQIVWFQNNQIYDTDRSHMKNGNGGQPVQEMRVEQRQQPYVKRKSWSELKHNRNKMKLDLEKVQRLNEKDCGAFRSARKIGEAHYSLSSQRNQRKQHSFCQFNSYSERKNNSIASIVDRNMRNIKGTFKQVKTSRSVRKFSCVDDRSDRQPALSDTLTPSQMNSFIDGNQFSHHALDSVAGKFTAKPSEILGKGSGIEFEQRNPTAAVRNANNQKSCEQASAFERISRNSNLKKNKEHSRTVVEQPRNLYKIQNQKYNGYSDPRNAQLQQIQQQPLNTPSNRQPAAQNGGGKSSNQFKSTWIKKDSADSAKYIPVNDGLWESLQDENFNQFFKMSKGNQVQTASQKNDKVKAGQDAYREQEISQFGAQAQRSCSVSPEKPRTSSKLASSSSGMNEIDSDEELNQKNFSGKLSNYLICEDQHKKNNNSKDVEDGYHHLEADYFINDMLKQIEATNLMGDHDDDQRLPQILKRSEDMFLEQLFSNRMATYEYLDDKEHLRNMQLRHQPNDLQRISELQEEYYDNNTMKTSFSKSRKQVIQAELNHSLEEDPMKPQVVEEQNHNNQQMTTSQNQLPSIHEEVSVIIDNLNKNLIPRELNDQQIAQQTGNEESDDAVNYDQSQNLNMIKLTSSSIESQQFQGMNVDENVPNVYAIGKVDQQAFTGAIQCTTSEPAPLLTNEEDFCMLDEGASANNDVLNIKDDHSQILDRNLSVLRDDSMLSNKGPILLRNNSIGNSRTILDQGLRLGTSNHQLINYQNSITAGYQTNLTSERRGAMNAAAYLSGNENISDTVPSEIQVSLSHINSARKGGQYLLSPRSKPSEGAFTTNRQPDALLQQYSSLNRQTANSVMMQKRAPPSIMQFSNQRRQSYNDNQSLNSLIEKPNGQKLDQMLGYASQARPSIDSKYLSHDISIEIGKRVDKPS